MAAIENVAVRHQGGVRPMALAVRFAGQLAHPGRLVGRVLGAAMDRANRRPIRLAIDLLDPQVGERILDVGCGTGAALAELLARAKCEVAGVDASPTMIARARGRLGDCARLEMGRIEDLPFATHSFAAVLALNVVYFSDREGRMIAALRRMLKPGGRLVAYVTHRATIEDWSFADAGYHRLFDEGELVAALVAGGFARERISVHASPVAPSVIGLFAVAHNLEAEDWPTTTRSGH